MDGLQLATAVRDREAAAAVGTRMPIIAVTANAMEGEAQRCAAAGMDAFLAKPVSIDGLRKVLARWLPSFEGAAASAAPAAQASAASSDPVPSAPLLRPGEGDGSPVDPAQLVKYIGSDDPALIAEFYTVFLQGSRDTAAELAAAWGRASAGAIADAAHRLKSSARAVGASRLADCCAELERVGRAGDVSDAGRLVDEFVRLVAEADDWITANMDVTA